MSGALVVEHKTTAADITPGAPYWTKLVLDAQVSAYYAGAAHLGHDVVGVLYDVLRKPALKPLAANSRRAAAETPEEFGERLVAEIASDPSAYYGRGIVVRTEDEMRAHRDDVWQAARQIARATADGEFPRNPDACERWGRQCDYWPVCSGETTIADPLRYRHEPSATPRALPLLSASSLSAWRSCSRLYLYGNVMRMRPIAKAKALTFGTAVHEALEAWWHTVDIGLALAKLDRLADPFERARAQAMVAGYHVRWKDEPLDVLAVEVEFETPLVASDGTTSQDFTIGGRIDAIARRSA